MTRLLAATAIAVVIASPAFAWTCKVGGNGVKVCAQDGGMGQGQDQRQIQRQGQRQSLSNTNTQNVTINPAAIPSGAADPSGAQQGFGGGSRIIGQAPDVLIPSIGGGGSDCPVVGFGVGGSGLGGGGGFGPSWISTRCDHRKYAEMIYELTGNRQAALSYLASVEPDVKEWMDSSAPAVASVAVMPTATVAPAFPDGDRSDEACPVGLYGAALRARPWCNQDDEP